MGIRAIGLAVAFSAACLWPAAAQAQPVDVTDQDQEVSAFVDVNGKATVYQWFRVSKVCQLSVTPAKGTGFVVAYWVTSENDSKIFGSLMGTQTKNRGATVPPGRYKFVINARRGAGYYTFVLSARCD